MDVLGGMPKRFREITGEGMEYLHIGLRIELTRNLYQLTLLPLIKLTHTQLHTYSLEPDVSI